MSKVTKLIATAVGAFFFTLSVIFYTAKWSIEDGRKTVEGTDETDNEETK